MPFSKEFEVANPSKDPRSDYVMLNVEQLESEIKPEQRELPKLIGSDSPELLPEGNKLQERLRLYRLDDSGNEVAEVPYQIDHVFGADCPDKAVLTFRSDNTPGVPDNEDYSKGCARFRLKEADPRNHTSTNDLYVGCHYEEGGDVSPEMDLGWNKNKTVAGLKFKNGVINELFFSLKRRLARNQPKNVNYTGAVTSINLKDAHCQDLTSPIVLLDNNNRKPSEACWSRWGQVSELVFFPAPWDLNWFQRENIWDMDYELVYKCSGPVRAVATVKTGPFTVTYRGDTWFKPEEKEIECYLYRILFTYPGKPWYGEKLVVLSKDRHSLSFRPYFLSTLFTCSERLGAKRHSWLHRFEHVPDYFALWEGINVFNSEMDIGYGFTSDAHIRGLHVDGNDIRWRLTSSHLKTCIHAFKAENVPNKMEFIAHGGWYEQVYKPLRALPLNALFYSPVPDE